MKPKKSLGQNFLNSGKIASEIVKAANVGAEDVVLEVGPGKGVLTEILLNKAKKVIAVEKDDRLFEYLKEKFSDRENLVLIHDDILDFSFEKHGLEIACPAKDDYKIVANIPYYITGHFFKRFLSGDKQPSLITIMIQKEVAERILGEKKKGKDGLKESILSISVKVYGEPKIVKYVSAKNFTPQPKVDSAVLLIDKISKDFFKDCGGLSVEECEKNFFQLLKTGFSRKRKMLKSNIDEMLEENVLETFKNCKIEEKIRAQDLTKEQWGCLVFGSLK